MTPSVLLVLEGLPAEPASVTLLRGLDRVARSGWGVKVLTFELDVELVRRVAGWRRSRRIGPGVQVVNAHDVAAGPDHGSAPSGLTHLARRFRRAAPDVWSPPPPLSHRTIVPKPSGLLPSDALAEPRVVGRTVVTRASGLPAVRARTDAAGRTYQRDHLRTDGSTYLVVTVEPGTGERRTAIALDPEARRATRYRRTADWERAWFARHLDELQGVAPVVLASSPWGLRFLSEVPSLRARWGALTGLGLTGSDVAGLPARRRPSAVVEVEGDDLEAALRHAAVVMGATGSDDSTTRKERQA